MFRTDAAVLGTVPSVVFAKGRSAKKPLIEINGSLPDQGAKGSVFRAAFFQENASILILTE